MKKILLSGLFLSVGLIASSDLGSKTYAKCAGCHGVNGEKAALGKSAIITGQDRDLTIKQLKKYKSGTLNSHGLGGLMKDQAKKLNDKEIEEVAKYISTFK